MDEIRDAALDLFTERGYEATTMADIGGAIGIRAPSLYKHVASKQELLAAITTATMDDLLAGFRAAVSGTDDVAEQLRRAVDAHVRFHARRRREAFVGNRELRSLVPPHRQSVLVRRAEYASGFVDLVQAGVEVGRFDVASAKLAANSILDAGMGVAVWFREDSGPSENDVAWQYCDFAMRLVSRRAPSPAQGG